jgi:hypothetical protein
MEVVMRKICVILALFTFCLVAEAAKIIPLTANSAVPAAKGQLEIDKDKNGNVRVKMQVEHLANPQNLTPPAAFYVVWFQDKGGNPENKGQMKVDKNLKGTFETISPSKSFDLFVTGEQDSNIKVPSGGEVLRTFIQP